MSMLRKQETDFFFRACVVCFFTDYSDLLKFLFIKTQKNDPPVTDIQPNGADESNGGESIGRGTVSQGQYDSASTTTRS